MHRQRMMVLGVALLSVAAGCAKDEGGNAAAVGGAPGGHAGMPHVGGASAGGTSAGGTSVSGAGGSGVSAAGAGGAPEAAGGHAGSGQAGAGPTSVDPRAQAHCEVYAACYVAVQIDNCRDNPAGICGLVNGFEMASYLDCVKDTCIPEVDDTSSETQCAAYVECMTACSKPAGC